MAARRPRGEEEEEEEGCGADEDHPHRRASRRICTPLAFSNLGRAMAQETTQIIIQTLVPLIRTVVREAIQEVFPQMMDHHIQLRSLPLHIQEMEVSPHLKLVFVKELKQPIFTNNKLVDVANNAIKIQLMDTRTNNMITLPVTHLGSLVKLEVLVLDGDFRSEDRDHWTADQFNAAIVKARDGKRPLLVGSLNVSMGNDGVSVIDDVSFTDNSSWVRCRRFRIGVRIMPGSHFGARIQEAVSESFMVKDHRGELYKKHYPPLLADKVWRLKNIGKDGPIHKRLESEGIKNVQEFLKLNTINPEKLKTLVNLSDKQWTKTLNHAKTCDTQGKRYVLKTEGCDITFNPIGEVLAARIGDQTYSVQELLQHQASLVKELTIQAYRQWEELEEVANEVSLAANLGRERSESQESMISSSSRNARHIDYTGTATSSAAATAAVAAAAMSTNGSSTSDTAAAVPATDATRFCWVPGVSTDDDHHYYSWPSYSANLGNWDQVD